MATVKKYSREELKDARKAGFKRKKPKKPKMSASLNVMENWIERHNEWVGDLKDKAKEYKKAETLRKQIKKV